MILHPESSENTVFYVLHFFSNRGHKTPRYDVKNEAGTSFNTFLKSGKIALKVDIRILRVLCEIKKLIF